MDDFLNRLDIALQNTLAIVAGLIRLTLFLFASFLVAVLLYALMMRLS